jgi:hypothetical protein
LAEAILREIFDELHDLDAVTVGLDPDSEFGMLGHDLIDEIGEHAVHLIADVVKIGRAEVGIVVDIGLDLRPFHLAAPLME